MTIEFFFKEIFIMHLYVPLRTFNTQREEQKETGGREEIFRFGLFTHFISLCKKKIGRNNYQQQDNKIIFHFYLLFCVLTVSPSAHMFCSISE